MLKVPREPTSFRRELRATARCQLEESQDWVDLDRWLRPSIAWQGDSFSCQWVEMECWHCR